MRVEVLDGATGAWRHLPSGELAAHLGDPTLRAFESGPGGRPVPLRAVAPGRSPGHVRIRGSGSERRETAQLCGADGKQSRGDLQAWLRDAPRRLRGVQIFLLVTPPGLAEPAELPARVGLAEVDLDDLRGPGGRPAIRVVRWPEPLRPASPWSAERTAEFQRRAYYALHGLFERQMFWFLAQHALDRRALVARGPAAGAAPGADNAPLRRGGREGASGSGRPSGG